MPKVMLIEDDKTMVDLLSTLLDIEGYEVVTFREGLDILPFIRSENPDVILLDVNLEHLSSQMNNGFDLLTAIRGEQDLHQIGVIISSGMNYQEESKAAGANGFVLKPYMPDDLLEMIKTTITKI